MRQVLPHQEGKKGAGRARSGRFSRLKLGKCGRQLPYVGIKKPPTAYFLTGNGTMPSAVGEG